MHLKAIIFDLDSTIIETRLDFFKMKTNMIKELEKQGHPKGTLSPTRQTTVQILEEAEKNWEKIGTPLYEREAISEKMEYYMNQAELESIKNLKPIPGAVQAIKKLKEKGYKLAILTRGHHAYVEEALKKLGINNQFNLILGRGETPQPKPYPEALNVTVRKLGIEINEALMVGDHQIDCDSATNSGCKFVGVATGISGLRSWTNEIPPPVLLDSVKDLPNYLETLERQ